MEDFDTCLGFVLDSEDPKRECETVPDDGVFAISGINSRAFPAQFAQINAVEQEHRFPMVYAFYKAVFWNVFLAQLRNKAAAPIMDMSVNSQPDTAVREAQSAAVTLGQDIAIDGHWGPKTVQAINACDDDQFAEAYCDQRRNRYLEIAAKNPAKRKYLAAWLARASRKLG